MMGLRFWQVREWRCAGCDSREDVWAIPVGRNRFDVRLCRSCRRELVRRILGIAADTTNHLFVTGKAT